VTAGDNTFSYLHALPVGHPAGAHALTAMASDAQGRTTGTLTFTLNSADCVNSSSTVVVSQVYGGGGNTGATLTHDFIELFNRSGGPVDISGWSVQYGSGLTDPDGFNVKTDIPTGTVIPAGGYYLIQEAAGAGGTEPLPTPDAVGTIAISQTRGVIALVNNTTLLGLTDCTNASIMDKVGFGNGTTDASGAYCAEELRTANISNTTAVMRRDNGCHDVDNNGIDFNIVAPAPRNSASPLNPCGGGCPGNQCGTSDYNGDGDFGTDQDIEAFFACLAGDCCATCFCQDSDFNGDGDFGTDQDIEAFFRVLAGGNC
jgi:hypothetical protein